MADESRQQCELALDIIQKVTWMVEGVAIPAPKELKETLLTNGVTITKAEIFGNMTITVNYTCKSDNKYFGDEAVSFKFNSGGKDWDSRLDLILKHI
jgi:hypothetical protein